MAAIGTRATAERAVELGKKLYREVVDDRVTGLAAEVAFFGVLSLFPGLLMITAALGSLDALVGSDLAQLSKQQILDFLNLILTHQASGAIQAVEQLFEAERGGLLTFASLLALWSLSRGFAAVVRALNLAYDITEERPWLRLRLLSAGLSVGTVLMTALMLGMIVLGPLFGRGQGLADLVGVGGVFSFAWRWLRWPFAFALLVAWAATLFHLAPCGRETGWRAALPGALLAAVLWLAVSLGFNLYLRLAAGANPIFGVLGGGLILLIWIYLLALSLLIGGELNGVLEPGKRKGGGSD